MEQEKPNHRIKIVALRNRPGLCGPAAAWFSGKWGIPELSTAGAWRACSKKAQRFPSGM